MISHLLYMFLIPIPPINCLFLESFRVLICVFECFQVIGPDWYIWRNSDKKCYFEVVKGLFWNWAKTLSHRCYFQGEASQRLMGRGDRCAKRSLTAAKVAAFPIVCRPLPDRCVFGSGSGSGSPSVQMTHIAGPITLSSDWTVCPATYGFEAPEV